MRTYFGSIDECNSFIQDKNHKVVAWKEHPFSFELRNETGYVLIVQRAFPRLECISELNPGESVSITCKDWSYGQMFIESKTDSSICCNFEVEEGLMIERNFVEVVEENKMYIAPIFNDGIVRIIECEDPTPNFGKTEHLEVVPLEHPYETINVENHTDYDIMVSVSNQIIQVVGSRQSAQIGIPEYGVLYVDTIKEEVPWIYRYDSTRKKVLKVNGCCIQIRAGKVHDVHYIPGPFYLEPYIRFLYSHVAENIKIWCGTIDYRLE